MIWGLKMTSKARVLFVCTANTARSQLLLRHADETHERIKMFVLVKNKH